MSDELRQVLRNRDGRLCGIFMVDVSVAVFVEVAQEHGFELKESKIYCETWKVVPSRSKRYPTRVKKCDPDDEGAVRVVGYDFLKWNR